MAIMGKHGISATTPSNILLGAGTFHKGLTFASGKWEGTCVGATSGGGKVSIVGEFVDMELDGAFVKVKGLTVKQGGTASMEVNFAELSADVIKLGMIGEEGVSEAEGYTMIQTKANISEGDYVKIKL